MRKISLLLMAGVVFGTLFFAASPASAHSSILSGETGCNNGTHLVTWTIGNDFGLQMTIDTATATVGNQSYPVVGYANPVGPNGSTSATTTIPGNVTGVVTLTVHSVWSDEFSQTNTTNVNLTVPCTEEMTTTTVPDTTTTGPPDTTTVPPVVETTTTGNSTTTTGPTTSVSAHSTTTYICVVPPTTDRANGLCWQSPHTGSNSQGLALAGLILVAVGTAATLIFGKRRTTA